MTPEQIHTFQQHGCLRLAGFHPARRMAPLRQQVLEQVRRLSGGKGMPKAVQGLPTFQQIGKLSSLVRLPGLHEALVTPELVEQVARLAGRAPTSVQPTQLLLSPPHQAAWSLERLNWHVDVTADPPERLPGVQAFFLIDDVAPQGGATLALAGSHRAASMPALRALLKAPVHLEQQLKAMDLSLVEMSGRMGDVFLMDMRLLHSPSVNATPRLRVAATARCFVP